MEEMTATQLLQFILGNSNEVMAYFTSKHLTNSTNTGLSKHCV